MQRALAGVPGIEQPSFDEEWAAATATSKKRRAVRQPSGSDGEDNESEERKRAAAKARFGSLRTAPDEELRRALDGSLAVKDITRPPGGAGSRYQRKPQVPEPAQPDVGGAKPDKPGKRRDGEIIAEPEEEHAEDVTMASDDREPEPAAGAPLPAAPVAAPAVPPAVPPAGTGVGFPFAGEEPDEPYIVENYVGDEHEEAMTAELAKEMAAGRIFDARDWLPRAEAQEMMDLLIEFVTMLGFKAVGVDAGGTDRQPDRDDWQFSPVLFAEVDEEFGPFTLDACVASSWANAFCVRSWSAEDDARKQRFDGLNAWANLPFSVMYEILLNFLKCKRKQQMGTGGCFLVPVWEGDEAYKLVPGMREVFRPELLEELAVAVERYQDGAYAESTQRSYDTGVKAFLTFCVRFACGGSGVPSAADLCVLSAYAPSW
ncbi:hypothetical protein CYMTET_7105 [Cymbomonas tetramitiformis]|uniref:Uncharacterized protein n=1 Tax=Cymbomonas tetramitiformis TaxID=36881 RepID=A0AAE0GVN0_9CHLO|nr:hypothetical protein CYMTET_7105 [Cymbomonas tetramitiformis]